MDLNLLRIPRQQTKKIKFVCTIQSVHPNFIPKPATRFIPNWFKEMESYLPNNKASWTKLATIKKCIPVFDAITAGYIIQSPCDVQVYFQDGIAYYESAINNLISEHPKKQAYKHPNATDIGFPKWTSPWSIETPKGYSTLFIPPMHNPNPWFEILEGIVDTDVYRHPVNFPFVLKETSKNFVIPAGTPIVQVIPIKRDVWKAAYPKENKGVADEDYRLTKSVFFHGYKNFFWKRKEYK